jgi:hypothetical protein
MNYKQISKLTDIETKEQFKKPEVHRLYGKYKSECNKYNSITIFPLDPVFDSDSNTWKVIVTNPFGRQWIDEIDRFYLVSQSEYEAVK